MVVMPPLIKEETRNAKIVQEDFILGYMVNDGYAEDVIAQHKNMPDLKLHCFWDRKGMPVTYSPHEHLTFHLIDNHLFTNYMTRCKGYISTAGFESICEAMYLGKPTLMIPVASQYEQACNAIDGELSGAGEKATSFNISQLINVIDNYQTPANFKQWVNQAEVFFNEELTNL